MSILVVQVCYCAAICAFTHHSEKSCGHHSSGPILMGQGSLERAGSPLGNCAVLLKVSAHLPCAKVRRNLSFRAILAVEDVCASASIYYQLQVAAETRVSSRFSYAWYLWQRQTMLWVGSIQC